MTVRRHLSKVERGVWNNIPAPSPMFSANSQRSPRVEKAMDRFAVSCIPLGVGWEWGLSQSDHSPVSYHEH